MQEFLLWFWNLSVVSQVTIVWFIAINIVSFFVYGFDKMAAVAKARRIPEKTLWVLALVGGSLGAILAMEYFHHKTKKISFYAIMTLILLLQLIGIFLLLMDSIPRFT